MRGALFAAAEIVVFMAAATLIGLAAGILIGRAVGRRTAPSPVGLPATDSSEEVDRLRKRMADLQERLVAAKTTVGELEAEREEVEALRREVARLKAAPAGGDDVERLRRLLSDREHRIAELEARFETAALVDYEPPPEAGEALTMRTSVGYTAEAFVHIEAPVDTTG